MFFNNVRSMQNKKNEIAATIIDLKPDIVALCETWTHSGVSDAFLAIPGYEITARLDRTDTTLGRGGGLVVYSRVDLAATRVALDTDFNQAVFITVPAKPSNLTLTIVYRSPNSSPDNNKLLCDLIRKTAGPTVIVGDFNYSGIDWESGTFDSASKPFFNATEDVFLTQCVDFPTHDSGNILDLVLTTNPALVDSVQDVGKLGKSDHKSILVSLNLSPKLSKSSELVPDYAKADMAKLREAMAEVNWMEVTDNLSGSDSWNL